MQLDKLVSAKSLCEMNNVGLVPCINWGETVPETESPFCVLAIHVTLLLRCLVVAIVLICHAGCRWLLIHHRLLRGSTVLVLLVHCEVGNANDRLKLKKLIKF